MLPDLVGSVRICTSPRKSPGLTDDTIRAALSPLRGIARDWAEDAKAPNPLAGLRLFGKGDTGRARRTIKPPERNDIDAIVEYARADAKDAILGRRGGVTSVRPAVRCDAAWPLGVGREPARG